MNNKENYLFSRKDNKLVVESTDLDKNQYYNINDFVKNNTNRTTDKINFSGAGLFVIIKCKEGCFFALNHRTKCAPRYPDQLGIMAGILEDWDKLNPKYRQIIECFEELLIFNKKSKRIVVPQNINYIKNIYSRKKLKSNINFKGYKTANHQIYNINEDIFRFYRNNQLYETNGNIIINSKYRKMFMNDIILIDLPSTSINDLIFYDGEVNNGELLNREIYLFKLEDIDNILDNKAFPFNVYKDGRVINKRNTPPISKISSDTIESIKNTNILSEIKI